MDFVVELKRVGGGVQRVCFLLGKTVKCLCWFFFDFGRGIFKFDQGLEGNMIIFVFF